MTELHKCHNCKHAPVRLISIQLIALILYQNARRHGTLPLNLILKNEHLNLPASIFVAENELRARNFIELAQLRYHLYLTVIVQRVLLLAAEKQLSAANQQYLVLAVLHIDRVVVHDAKQKDFDPVLLG